MRIGLIVNGRLHALAANHLYDVQLVDWLYHMDDDVAVIPLPEAGLYHALRHNVSEVFFEHLRLAQFDLLLQDAAAYPSLFWLNHRLRQEAPYPIVAIVQALPSETEWRPWLKHGRRFLEQHYFETVDAFICSSQAARVAVEKITADGVERPSMVAYPGGDRLPIRISEHEIISRAQAQGPLRILFVGRYEQRQALISLLSALNYLQPHLWRLEVASDFVLDSRAVRRWLQPMIAMQVDRIDIRQNVTFCGEPTPEAMAEIYQRNQIAVIPDGDGVLGAAIVEAMGFGLVVVGTTRGAALEIIKHGRHGFRLSPNNSIVMARHLALLAQNRRLLLRLGLAAYQRAQTHPTWAESMGAVRDFLEDVVAKKRSLQRDTQP